MPDDPKLGPFRQDYGNLLGMMEERPINPSKVEVPFEDAERVKRSVRLFREMYENQSTGIDQNEFIRARLFDILVGDWGKHEDNWKWAGYQAEDGSWLYRPMCLSWIGTPWDLYTRWTSSIRYRWTASLP